MTEFDGHSDKFGMILRVTPVMEKHFTKEQIELGAKVLFFHCLAIDDPTVLFDLAEGEEIKTEWVTSFIEPDKRMVRASGRIDPKDLTNEV